MEEQLDRALVRETRPDVEELRQRVASAITLALIASSCIGWWSLLPRVEDQWRTLLVFLSLSLVGMLARLLLRRSPLAARATLLLGPVLSLCLALKMIGGPVVPNTAVLVVLANAAISPLQGIAAAALTTVALGTLLPVGEPLFSALALLWLGAGLQWISSRSLYTVLG